MIDVNELRKGVTIELDGALLKVIDYEHNKACVYLFRVDRNT